MAQRKRKTDKEVTDYRHDAKRKNLPPAAMAAHGKVAKLAETRYAYDPHLPPVLRFDETGEADRLPDLLAEARQRKLTDEEVRLLAEALRDHQPWLEWAGKHEKRWFDVDPVAVHIHERVSAQAIIKLAERKPLQRSLFADPELNYRQAVQFYQHDVDWANRLILGDSLTVMHSLARREDLAGKVQMIYIDHPYGIKFRSNFQPFVRKRSVKDREADLTREPEQVKAYRDTWRLGIHSYLAYLCDRLMVARELLTDSGSIFVQISDENVHRVRMLLDEVFGPENFARLICFGKTSGLTSKLLNTVFDFILWYAKDLQQLKFRPIYEEKSAGEKGATKYTTVLLEDGRLRPATRRELFHGKVLDGDGHFCTDDNLTSQGNPVIDFEWQGKKYSSPWKTTVEGLTRLGKAGRLYVASALSQNRP